ncbi:hypothetical protein C8J57DRAFT_1225836 [Mycena rebaudengoi]|nr:hypothetical protein C8J57DRAFT_1225836 [Mycena rebaudengoi]
MSTWAIRKEVHEIEVYHQAEYQRGPEVLQVKHISLKKSRSHRNQKRTVSYIKVLEETGGGQNCQAGFDVAVKLWTRSMRVSLGKGWRPGRSSAGEDRDSTMPTKASPSNNSLLFSSSSVWCSGSEMGGVAEKGLYINEAKRVSSINVQCLRDRWTRLGRSRRKEDGVIDFEFRVRKFQLLESEARLRREYRGEVSWDCSNASGLNDFRFGNENGWKNGAVVS